MDSVRFDTLLARSDEETLRRLVGQKALHLLQLLDPGLARPSVLRQLVIDFYLPAELLRDPEARSDLLMLMRPEEALQLCRELSLPSEPTSVQAAFKAINDLQIRRDSVLERKLQQALGLSVGGLVAADHEHARENTIEVTAKTDSVSSSPLTILRARASIRSSPSSPQAASPPSGSSPSTASDDWSFLATSLRASAWREFR